MVMIRGGAASVSGSLHFHMCMWTVPTPPSGAPSLRAIPIAAPLDTPCGDRRATVTGEWESTWQIATGKRDQS